MELDEVLFQRDSINSRLLTVIDAATEPWGVKVNRIEIKDLTPPADITNAMARQMKAERERRAVITEADGEKQAAIARRRGRQTGRPSSRPRAAARPPSATPEAREREAEAEAKATAMVSQAIAAGDVNDINYFVAQKYVEAFAELARNPTAKTVIVPAESPAWSAPSRARRTGRSGEGTAAEPQRRPSRRPAAAAHARSHHARPGRPSLRSEDLIHGSPD